jgi:hypothetical protein
VVRVSDRPNVFEILEALAVIFWACFMIVVPFGAVILSLLGVI